MRIKIIILIFILIPIIGKSQKDTINQRDENNLKQGYWINYYSEGKTKTEEGTYIDDLRVGSWIFYYPDGESVKTKGQFINGVANGSYKKYYDIGNLKEMGIFYDNNYYGERKKYYENGQLEELAHFDNNGVQIDTTINFFSSGEIERKRVYDTSNHIMTDIYYNKDGTYHNTEMVVTENQSSFSILQIAPNIILDNANSIVGNYHFKLTFEGTPIFREHLLIIHQDSTYEIFKYIYESCYNYIDYSKGSWTLENNMIYLDNNQLMPSEFIIEGQSLISKEVKEIDGKNRVYNFKKVYP